ncbi:hypothetical protein JB92DRAFT_348833 [Gautieria morchelliformis]|nr:hypothetical protein JB92DRAFT_348833 [Gautieria morchelliformis]
MLVGHPSPEKMIHIPTPGIYSARFSKITWRGHTHAGHPFEGRRARVAGQEVSRQGGRASRSTSRARTLSRGGACLSLFAAPAMRHCFPLLTPGFTCFEFTGFLHSVVTLDMCVRNFATFTGYSLGRPSTYNPAAYVVRRLFPPLSRIV